MIAHELAAAIAGKLPFAPNQLQTRLIALLGDYICNHSRFDVFVLNGYAGSGKTSIMGALINVLSERRVNSVTLAPTGRAAKVAADFSGGSASTIHKRIFRPDSDSPEANYYPAPNPDRDTLFICDEASLITDSSNRNDSLLWQLLRHVYSGPGCFLILVGDIAQLPPVGMEESPAMNPERLRGIGLNPITFTLDLPMRQASSSGILANATRMRQLLFSASQLIKPELEVGGYEDVCAMSSEDLADALAQSWREVGVDNTIIITRSNYRANKYNMAIRNLVMMAEEPLQRGDRLVISKNDYYWSKINKIKNFIANGDMAEVKWVGKTEKMYGRYFTDVELYFPSTSAQLGCKIMLRSLACEGPAIPRAEMDRFHTHALAEYEGTISEKIKGVREDPFYNALQAKYGYCITCHKAQGGQWKHVYVDMAGIDPSALDENFYRWAYTAITRATIKLFFINPSLPLK